MLHWNVEYESYLLVFRLVTTYLIAEPYFPYGFYNLLHNSIIKHKVTHDSETMKGTH